MIIPANILCKHSRVNNPWRTILPTKTNMDARHCRTELKTMSSLSVYLRFTSVDLVAVLKMSESQTRLGTMNVSNNF